MGTHAIKRIVRETYGRMAEAGCGCSCGAPGPEISETLGYSKEEIKEFPGANLGLGCGNPTALAGLKEGMTVLDLGSGAGFDCFLAARKVGKSGRVIGVDMTLKMVLKARKNAKIYRIGNVEFLLGDIEKLPVADRSVDVIISNCVINLAPDKAKVFQEACRVLKPGGKLLVSDIVLLEELKKHQRADKALIAGCVGGALLRGEYLRLIKAAGFRVRISSEDKEISKRQYAGIPLESLKLVAVKK